MNPRPCEESLPPFISHQTQGSEYFFLNSDPTSQQDIVVVCGGFERCTSDYDVNRSSFPYYTLEFIVSGSCGFETGGQARTMGPGGILCYAPGSRHRIANSGGTVLQKFFVCLQGHKVPDVLWHRFLGKESTAVVAEYQWIHDLFRQLQDAGTRGGPQAQEICATIVKLMISRIEQLLASAEENSTTAQKVYQKCRAYIETHFREIQSLEEVAEACHLSRGYLSRLFTQFSNRSPSQLLIDYKMNHAAKLLRGGRMIVKEVAEAVGYNDPLYFSQSFKKHFGTAPKFFAQTAVAAFNPGRAITFRDSGEYTPNRRPDPQPAPGCTGTCPG